MERRSQPDLSKGQPPFENESIRLGLTHAASSTSSKKTISRWGFILATLLIGTSFSGFLMGINAPHEPTFATSPHTQPALTSESTSPYQINTVPMYNQIDSSQHGVNRTWHSDLSKLHRASPGVFESVVRTPEMKHAALIDRVRTRAFDGAPPAIPHPIDQRSADNCLACHGQGLLFAGKVASKMSHPFLTNCTQCHVEQHASLPPSVLTTFVKPPDSKTAMEARELVAASTAENQFDGTLRAGPGKRLLIGAPPSIPHTLYMREDCMSCHGLIARPGLRTTHPWLQNCRQCHAAEAPYESLHPLVVANPPAPR